MTRNTNFSEKKIIYEKKYEITCNTQLEKYEI